MDINGRIKSISETVAFGANNFRKRELVVTTDEQYPQHILIEFTQDKCDILNNYSVGQPVKVGINLRGREWVNPQGETKYFNSIQGWRIEAANQQQAQYSAPSAAGRENSAADAYQNNAANTNEPYEDDLPF